jgi:hypothetical protein
MKFWTPLLFLLLGLLVLVLWRSRERFSNLAVEPTCPSGMILVGDKCRTDAVALDENGQCPEGTSMNEEGACQRQADPTCPADHTLVVENGIAKCEPNNRPPEPTDEERQTASNSTGTAAPATTPEAPATTPAAAATTAATEGVTPATVRKNTVLGPVFTSYGAPIDGNGVDSSKNNQYPELLGGGDPASRRRQGGGFGIGIGSLAGFDLQGAMPTAAGLGATEQSKFLPYSRQPGDMELIPDPYRVSQQFSSASYSFKTEPTPFLTDFSAFLR